VSNEQCPTCARLPSERKSCTAGSLCPWIGRTFDEKRRVGTAERDDLDDVAYAALSAASVHFARHPANDETAEAVCAWITTSMREFGYDVRVRFEWRGCTLHFLVVPMIQQIAFHHTVKL
jgi:hypothetical protein